MLGQHFRRGLVLSIAAFVFPTLVLSQESFVRGDFNRDGQVDIADPIGVLIQVFIATVDSPCMSAGDVNDDDSVSLPDGTGLLTFLFLRGAAPAEPFPDCGVDPTTENLECFEFAPCETLNRDPVITEWVVPWQGSRPRDPYVGPDGRVWFVGQRADYAAYLIPETGDFTRFDLPSGAGPHNLIVSDFVWYAGNADAHIGKLAPTTGDITQIAMPDARADDPHTLVFDQAGNIWFTVQRGNFVGRLLTQTNQVQLIPVPTSGARPYGIEMDSSDRPWVVEFGSNKLATVNTTSLELTEITLPRSAARPRRIGITSDDRVWYVDYSQGYLGRYEPDTGDFTEWPMPGGSGARPYGMAVDHRDLIWFVETGSDPNRFVGFDPSSEEFFSDIPIPSGGDGVRHMYFHAPTRSIWFGTDANTIGRASLE